MTGFLCLKSGNIKEWLLLEWKILNTHLMFDWMTSLCWRGWVWYDGLRRSSSLVTRFGAFFNDVIIIITWRAGSYPPETDSPCPCHCRSWWCPPCWWSRPPGIRAPLEMSCQKYPGTCLYWPWTESTLSWNPWDTAPRPDLNSTQRLLLCPGTRGLYLYQTTLGAHQSGWPGAGWSCSWRRLSWTGPCQTETPSARRSSPGAETVCKGERCHWVIRIRSHLGRISSTLRVWPGDTLHLHSAPVWRTFIKTIKTGHVWWYSLETVWGS